MRRSLAAIACAFVIATTVTPSNAAVNAVVAGPGASTVGYLHTIAVVVSSADATFINLDVDGHDVVSRDKRNGQHLFKSQFIGVGETSVIEGLETLPVGEYEFYCSAHDGRMIGTIRIVA